MRQGCAPLAILALACLTAAASIKHEASSNDQALFDRCDNGWIGYNNRCYKYTERDQYWYEAEQDCRRQNGNLVSIASESENSFVAKLTYCEPAWTGRYAVNVDKLSEPGNYRWTDNSSSSGSGYHAHNFTSIGSIHEPLISVSNLQWLNNVYHARHKYVCKAKYQGGGGGQNVTCEPGWKLVNNFCYLMPDFPSSFIEATFYCSGRSAHLTSIYSALELRALSLLDLQTRGCPVQTWVGLIKVNPCRVDFSSGDKICYKWADRLVDFHNDFPAWHPGHPDNGDKIKCVLLRDRAMETVECHERHRFICKKAARRL